MSLLNCRSMAGMLRPLRGDASLLMQTRGGAFTLYPWLMASKPPACWKPHRFEAARPRKLYGTFNRTLRTQLTSKLAANLLY